MPLQSDYFLAKSKALEWLKGQLKPLLRGSLSVISDEDHSYDYVGVVSGSFEPPSDGSLVPGSLLKVTSPYPIPPSYAGEIRGLVGGVPSGNYLVRGYLFTDIEYLQGEFGPFYHSGSGTSSWSINALGFSGEWRFKLFNADTLEQVGPTWTENLLDRYEHYALRFYLVTDIEYFQSEIPAYSDLRWEFNKLAPGTVVVRLVRTDTNEIRGEYAPETGRVRSYELEPGDAAYGTPFEHRTYLYDQALTILALLREEEIDLAVRCARSLLPAQLPDGSWPFSFGQLSPVGDPYLRSGAIAWAAYAMAAVLKQEPDPDLEQGLRRALGFLSSLQHSVLGLVKGGKGRYGPAPAYVFDPDYVVPWYSTEHNLDCYFAFMEAHSALGDQSYLQAAQRIRDGMLAHLWNPVQKRFYQGLQNDLGTPDTAGALDCYSWGAAFLVAVGETEKAKDNLSRAELLYKVGEFGYKPYSADDGYPGAQDVLWLEGSFGVVTALLLMGKPREAGDRMENYLTYQTEDGAFRYALSRDGLYEISTYKSVASTAWSILASGGVFGLAPTEFLEVYEPSCASPINGVCVELEEIPQGILVRAECPPSSVLYTFIYNEDNLPVIVHRTKEASSKHTFFIPLTKPGRYMLDVIPSCPKEKDFIRWTHWGQEDLSFYDMPNDITFEDLP